MKFAAYQNYKPSGTDWLGNIPVHWNASPLKHTANIQTGYAFSSDDFTDEGIPVLRISDITKEGRVDLSNAKFLPIEYASEFRSVTLKNGDIVMAMTGATIGKVGRYEYETPCLLNQRVCSFEAIKNNDQKYIWYLLNSDFYTKHIALTAFGGAQPNISDTQLLACDAPLPPIEEQQNIARFLDAKTAQIDTLMAKKRQLIEKLKEKRSALIACTVTRGLPPAAAKAAGLEPNPQMKDSGLKWIGEIPNHWNSKRLKYLFRCFGGGTPSKANAAFWDGDIPWVSPKDMYQKTISDTEDHISKEALEESATRMIAPGATLIVVRSGILKHTIPVAINAVSVTINQDMKALISTGAVNNNYLAYFIEGHNKSLLDIWSKSGCTVESIESDNMLDSLFPVPPHMEQQTITNYLDRETAKIDQLTFKVESAITRLTEYRQALITAAVTGKIDVREAVI